MVYYKMSKNIRHWIDACFISYYSPKLQTVKLHIRGWGFSEKSKSPLKIEVLKMKTDHIKVTQYTRQDIFNAYPKYPGALNSGFSITISDIHKSINFIKIKFIDETNKEYEMHTINIKSIIEKEINKIQEYEYIFYEETIPKEWIEIQEYQPKISILMPLNKIKGREKIILEAINSLFNQLYGNWEICMAVKESELGILKKLLTNYKFKIKYVQCHEYASKEELINNALKISTGEYIGILEQEDIICKNALAYVIEALNQNNRLKVIYTDEDRFIENGDFFSPIYKKDIDLKNEFGERFILKLGILDKKIIDSLGGYSKDTIKKVIEVTNPSYIKHIEKIAYHNRAVEDVWQEKDHNVRTIAFYLPQFHPIPENDKWWGKGFTEWTNVRRAKPLFEGHYQPREPGELGYYNLVKDKSIQKKQIQLAKQYGISGFCYYYYWFNGKRLLEKPLNQFIENKELDFPFCIMWANENWTRRWDGLDNEILIEQIHEKDSDERFIRDIIPLLKDKRYIKINGAPLLLIYKIELLKNPIQTIKTWRKICKKQGVEHIHISYVIRSRTKSPIYYGADSMFEFPPNTWKGAMNITKQVKGLVKNFKGRIFSYESYANLQVQLKKEEYKLFRTCMLYWDNTARRLENAGVFHKFSIEAYKKWLLKCIDYVKRFHSEEEQIVFINAWNEWAEGAYLEPDKKNGRKYLEATKEALNYR